MYDTLTQDARDQVDRMVDLLQPLGWAERRRRIRTFVTGLHLASIKQRAADPERTDPTPKLPWDVVGLYVAACIERLGDADPDNQDQALIYLLSWDPEHVRAANRFFNENPEQWAVVEAKDATRH